LLVVGGGEEVSLVRDAELDDPAVAVGVFVDLLGAVIEGLVDLDDLAADRGVDVRDGLDGLDGAEGVSGVEGGARFGELDEDDVAELILGVVGDADGGGVVLGADPFVALGVLKLLRYAQGFLLPYFSRL
jgi:hypothetical protein